MAQAKEKAEIKMLLEDRQKVSTCDLVHALTERVGVKSIQVKPYETNRITVEGPKILLVVED